MGEKDYAAFVLRCQASILGQEGKEETERPGKLTLAPLPSCLSPRQSDSQPLLTLFLREGLRRESLLASPRVWWLLELLACSHLPPILSSVSHLLLLCKDICHYLGALPSNPG